MRDLTVFILAGGRSSRMGADKAFLEFEGRTLLERALVLARELSEQVRIVGQRDKFAPFAPVIEDIFPDRGPLAGIHAALTSSATDLNLVLAVDTPFLQASFLNLLIAKALGSDAVVTAPQAGGRNQPLCAVYRRSFAPLAEQALKAGRNKIDPLFALVKSRIIDENELRMRGFDAAMFQNLNTPEDVQRVRSGTSK